MHITRRVYRSGEGEYLINRQPARLRDIRDLFAGTGMATEAYSIIEQGKVDVLLQASPRDRRLIFEEAAGISRFKAKKIEAQRRLERVEQNLLRLSDIVEEVDNRLRAVRMQAAKARRYKEYADRLQELRTQVGLADWRALSGQLAAIETELAQMRDEAADRQRRRPSGSKPRRWPWNWKSWNPKNAIRSNEARIAQNRERIAAYEATIDHERRLMPGSGAGSRPLSPPVDRHEPAGRQSRRSIARDDRGARAAAEREHREVARRVAEQERALTRLTAELDELRTENEQRRTAHLEQLRVAAALGNQISALESQVLAAAGSLPAGRRSPGRAGRHARHAAKPN